MEQWRRLVVVMAALSLVACSGGGGTTDGITGGENPPPAPTQVSGQVADGYLQGAKVCLDVNENKKCDDGEPTATTGAEGRYVMGPEVLGDFNAALYPVLVEVPPSAIDEDTGAPVGKEYVLSAPAGKPEFVSPITTLVQNQIESNPGLTPEMAEKTVKEQIGASESVSLFEDYAKPANKTVPEFQAVHRVAQVVARTMADMKTQVEAAASEAGVNVTQNYDAIVKLVVEEVMNRLQTIVTTVNTVQGSGGTFNPDTAAQTVATQAGTVETSTITQRIEEKKAAIVKSSFETMLEGTGVYWLESWPNGGRTSFEYGNVRKPADSASPVDARFVRADGQWVPKTGDETAYMLTTQGWLPYSDEASSYTVTFNTDGTAVLKHKTTGIEEKLTAVEYDLSGKPHGPFAGGVTEALKNPAATFPDGAKAYRLTFVPQQGSYVYHVWMDDQGNDGNYVRYYDQQEVALTSLAQVKSVFAPTASPKRYLEVQWTDGEYNIAVQFGADNKLLFFKRYRDWNRQPDPIDQTGTWSEIVVAGETLLKMEIPETLRAMFRFSGAPFLAARDGKVRSGIYRPAGVVETEKNLNFNKAAFDALVANIDFSYPHSVRLALKAAPLYEIEADPYDPFLGYAEIGVDSSGAPVEKEYEYDFQAKVWNLLTDDESDWVLSTSGSWVEADDLPQDFTFVHNADGSATLTHKATGLRRTLTVTREDLAGRMHGYVAMGAYSMLKDSKIAFPAGAFAYRPVFELVDGLYEVEKWIDSDMGGGGDMNGFYLSPEQLSDGFTGTLPFETIPDFPAAYGDQTQNYVEIRGDWGSTLLRVQFAANGVLACYRQPTDFGSDPTPVPLDLKGSWEIKTVRNQQLLMITLPVEYAEQYGVEGQPFVAKVNGVFKYGTYYAPGMDEEEEDLLFNKVAFESLKANLKLESQSVSLLRKK